MQSSKLDTRIVSPIESKEQWDALVDSISTEGDAIVESRSGARAAIISYEEFMEFQQQRKERMREEAFAKLQDVLKDQAQRNADLTQEEIEALAERASRESFEELVAEGKLVFKRDQE